jgi:hypothetical protein
MTHRPKRGARRNLATLAPLTPEGSGSAVPSPLSGERPPKSGERPAQPCPSKSDEHPAPCANCAALSAENDSLRVEVEHVRKRDMRHAEQAEQQRHALRELNLAIRFYIRTSGPQWPAVPRIVPTDREVIKITKAMRPPKKKVETA